jgi:sigma-B regulation protein RsbU (phosphoserine phosphatase)
MYSVALNLAEDPPGSDDSAPEAATRSPGDRRAADLKRAWSSSDGLVEMPSVAVACHSTSVFPCGGDLCSVYPLGEALLVVIGDVAGHHYDAALVSALAKGACDVAVNELRPLGPARLLEVLERTIFAATRGRITMSCSAALVASRTLTMASAGHPLPYVVRAGGDRLEGVRSFGALLGTGDTKPRQTTSVPLRPGDRVLWYTDGVLDATDEAGGRFGHRRLQSVLRRSHGLPAHSMVEAIAAELFWLRGDAEVTDDASFAVAELR